MGAIIIVLIALCGLGSLMQAYQENPERIKQKVKERLQIEKDMFNNFTKRFLKCAYPYTDYLLALGMAQNKGFSQNITTEQINFYLSYPKKYELKEITGVKDKYYLYVNGLNLGPAEKCWLINWKQFNEDSQNNPRNDKKIIDRNIKTFFIDKYVIGRNFSFLGNENNTTEHVKGNSKFEDNLTYMAFQNIENESNENLKDCETLITKELQEFIDKLQEKDYSIKEMEELYEENNKKWQEEYFNKYTDKSKEEYFNTNNEHIVYQRDYEDDGNYLNVLYRPSGGENIYFNAGAYEDKSTMEEYRQEVKNKNVKEMGNDNYTNVYWDEKYANAIKDIELKYDLKENEPALTTDFRKQHYNNRIARKAIVDHVKYNPLLQTAKFVYKDGTSFDLKKPI